MEASRVICVLGMHRSGTSCLAGTLEQGGLQLGDVQTHNPANLRGNRESPRIIALHDDLLRANGCAWDRPPEPHRELGWNAAQRAERDAIIAEFADRPLWGFKDPRTLLALAGWREALPGLVTVGIFRHPLAVARSLEARGDMPREKALTLWTAYNQRLLAEWRRRKFPLLSFDGGEADFRAQAGELGRQLGLAGDLGGETFFAAELCNQRVEEDGALPGAVAEVYAELRRAAMPTPPAVAPRGVVPELTVIVPGGDVRLLQSLRAGYQLGVKLDAYEVLILAEDAPDFGPTFYRCPAAELPARIRGKTVAILTDGAALLSPGLIELAVRLAPDAVLTAPTYQLDPAQLAQTGWPHAAGSGHRLFDAAQATDGFGEYSFVAMARSLFDQLGGDVRGVSRLEGVRWLLAAGEGTFHGGTNHAVVALPEQAFELHGRATRRLLGRPCDLPLALGDGTAVAQLKAKNNELRAKIETLKAKNNELRARGDRWKQKAEQK